jgi:hypothetical protein
LVHRTIFQFGQYRLISGNHWRLLLLLVLLLAGAADMGSLTAEYNDDDDGTLPAVVTLQSQATAEMPSRKSQLHSTPVFSSTNLAPTDPATTLFSSSTQSLDQGDPAPLIAPLRC